MKFSCSRNDLIEALNIVRRGVAQRSPMQVLGGILFNVKDHRLYLTGSDLKISIKTDIPVDAQKEGAVIIDSYLIQNIISKLSGDTVYFQKDDKNRVKIESQFSEFLVNGLPAEEFAEFPEPKNSASFKVRSDILKSLIDGTRFAVATLDNFPVLKGIKLEEAGDSLKLIACDGFRLAVKKGDLLEKAESGINIVVPVLALSELSSILAGKKEEVKVTVSPTHAFFEFGPTVLATRLVEGNYVDYESIYPDHWTTRFVLNPRDLLSCCERANLMSGEGEGNLVAMNINSGKIIVTSRNDHGDFRDEVDIENDGDDLKISFNTRFFIDALKAVPEDKLIIEMTNVTGPAELKPFEGDEFSYLVLPVRVAE